MYVIKCININISLYGNRMENIIQINVNDSVSDNSTTVKIGDFFDNKNKVKDVNRNETKIDEKKKLKVEKNLAMILLILINNIL